jgi:beta-galactosidase
MDVRIPKSVMAVLVFACSGLGAERQSINQGWRFTNGDPAGVDSRTPTVRCASGGSGPCCGTPGRAHRRGVKIGNATHAVLKPFILPSGDRFTVNRHERPAGNPGADLAFTQAPFDDSGWRHVDLPHDWAIEGPFAEGGGGGMGRLPSAGIRWYRRKLDIPASDANKRVFLEVEGAMSYAAVWVNGTLAGGWPYGYASWSLRHHTLCEARRN